MSKYPIHTRIHARPHPKHPIHSSVPIYCLRDAIEIRVVIINVNLRGIPHDASVREAMVNRCPSLLTISFSVGPTQFPQKTHF